MKIIQLFKGLITVHLYILFVYQRYQFFRFLLILYDLEMAFFELIIFDLKKNKSGFFSMTHWHLWLIKSFLVVFSSWLSTLAAVTSTRTVSSGWPTHIEMVLISDQQDVDMERAEVKRWRH